METEILFLPIKFLKLKKLVGNQNKYVEKVLFVAEEFMLGLNQTFSDREISESALQVYTSLFVNFVEVKPTIAEFEGRKAILFLMDVWRVVRNSWEFTDPRGKHMTGDDLHNAMPLFFEDKETIDTEDLAKVCREFFLAAHYG